MNWTALEIEIMTTLACKVRVLSEQQIVRGWQHQHSTETLAFSVGRLNAARLIRAVTWSVVLPAVESVPVRMIEKASRALAMSSNSAGSSTGR